MTIGVDGNYVMRFSLNGVSDFIAEEDLFAFSLIEYAGGRLPEFTIDFQSSDDSLLSTLNETSDLQISYGRDLNDLVDSALVVQGLDCIRQGGERRRYGANGFYSAVPFMTQTNSFLSTRKSGVEVLNDLVSQHFTPDFNIESSNDSQVWIQPNITDRAFARELWMHSDLPNSFPAIGITSSGRFVLRDVGQLLKEDFKFRFTPNILQADPKSIPYDGDFVIRVSRGFVNNWVGYDRDVLNFDLDDGSQNLVKETIQPLLALTQNFAKRADVGRRFGSHAVVNQNVHENYWSAAARNLSHLVQFGDTEITLSFSGLFVPIQVLDLVMFIDDKPASPGRNETSESNSGLYLVSRVARNYANRQFTTVVRLVRESMNDIRGESVKLAIDSETATEEANEEARNQTVDPENLVTGTDVEETT